MTFAPGDRVVVRTAGEILSTLDAAGACEGMPFMPEMLPLLGGRFTVAKRAQKVCDTIQYTGSRRLETTVLLDDLRCDGSAHDACQAECRFYWKEAWLRAAAPADAERGSPGAPEDVQALSDRVAAHVRSSDDRALYRCQATELLGCTTRYALWEPGQYVREVTCGNVTPARFASVFGRALVWESKRKLGLLPVVHLPGQRREPVADEGALGLQPGDWVEVKSREELKEALTPEGRNRGLWFDWEMERYCGGRYRVRSRVTRFIDDRNRKMVVLKTDAVTLDGVTCTGEYSSRRWFCPRAVYPYWRESWLKRVDASLQATVVPNPLREHRAALALPDGREHGVADPGGTGPREHVTAMEGASGRDPERSWQLTPTQGGARDAHPSAASAAVVLADRTIGEGGRP